MQSEPHIEDCLNLEELIQHEAIDAGRRMSTTAQEAPARIIPVLHQYLASAYSIRSASLCRMCENPCLSVPIANLDVAPQIHLDGNLVRSSRPLDDRAKPVILCRDLVIVQDRYPGLVVSGSSG